MFLTCLRAWIADKADKVEYLTRSSHRRGLVTDEVESPTRSSTDEVESPTRSSRRRGLVILNVLNQSPYLACGQG
jgi:hypothetical protein